PNVDAATQEKLSLDSLPYDAFHNLISFISGRTRASLGTTCRALHRFDRAAGKRKFLCIVIDWTKVDTRIRTYPYKSSHEMMFTRDSIEEASAVEFLRNARVEQMYMNCPNNGSYNEEIANFLKDIKYRRLQFEIAPTNVDIISFMMAERTFAQCNLSIEFSKGSSSKSVQRALYNISFANNLTIEEYG
ncbi:hypothetical protein PFISCL1PPCAC_14236, partial [Pristionchus fissidentatus]